MIGSLEIRILLKDLVEVSILPSFLLDHFLSLHEDKLDNQILEIIVSLLVILVQG